MARRPARRVWLSVPIYDRWISVYFGYGYAAKRIGDYTPPTCTTTVAQVVDIGYDDGTSAVALVLSDRGRPDVNTLSHESVHLAMSVLQSAGIPVNHDTQEALAYLVGYLVERLTALVARHYGGET